MEEKIMSYLNAFIGFGLLFFVILLVLVIAIYVLFSLAIEGTGV